MAAGVDGADRRPRARSDAAPGATAAATPADADTGPERWCYAGEHPTATVGVGDGWAAVTTHRLLLYDPSDGGRNLVCVDRPNVEDLRTDAAGTTRYLEHLPDLVVYTLVLLGGWVGLSFVDLGALFSTSVPSGAGIGGLSSMLSTFRLGFSLLSTGLLLGGVLCGVASLALGGLYVRSRERRLVVDRAGEDPIEHPLPTGGVDAERLRAALGLSDAEGPASAGTNEAVAGRSDGSLRGDRAEPGDRVEPDLPDPSNADTHGVPSRDADRSRPGVDDRPDRQERPDSFASSGFEAADFDSAGFETDDDGTGSAFDSLDEIPPDERL